MPDRKISVEDLVDEKIVKPFGAMILSVIDSHGTEFIQRNFELLSDFYVAGAQAALESTREVMKSS